MIRATSLAVPALVLSVAAGLALARPVPPWLAAPLQAAPLVVFVGGALLGLLLGRSRLVLGLLVLVLADLAQVHASQRAVFDAVSLLLPLNLGLIAWLPEVSLLTARGAAPLGVALLQAGVVATLQHPALAAVAAVLERPLVETNLPPWTTLPQVAVMAFTVALGLILAPVFVENRRIAAGAAWALVASFLALDGAGAGRPATVYFVGAGLLLVAGLALEPRRVRYLDVGTGLPGRLALSEALRRLPRRYALARVDIDEFRWFREEHGAQAAQIALRVVGRELAKVGGHGRAFFSEAPAFAVVFRRTSAAVAARHLEVVRRAVEIATFDVQVPVPARGDRPAEIIERTVAVTISVGVAEPERRGAGPREVLLAAEHALDRAKQAGQNRVAGPSAEWSNAVGAG